MNRFNRMIRKALILPLVAFTTLLNAAPKGDDFELVRNTEIMINMMRALQQYYVDSISSDDIMLDASYGISSALDPYTTYIDEEGMKDFEIITTGKYGGIGAVIRQSGDYVAIAEPYRDSPSDKSGLRIGDRIVEIEGRDAKGMTTEEMSGQLKGTPGSKVNIVVCSVLDSTLRKVTIRRERIEIPSIPYYGMLDGSVAYLRHSDFTDGCYDRMRSALKELEQQGMESLILDYRSNGGGVMQEAIKILSLFVPNGSEVLMIKDRSDSTLYHTAGEPPYKDLPLAVLINGSSASATEIVAGALQDMDRAVLIGQRSFGKGLVQSTVPVGYNSYMKLTTARYYIPSGRCIQAIDYSKRGNQDGYTKTADSLRKEFLTQAGRKVLDGGGITPDVEMESRYVSRFAMTLYSLGLIEEWGEEYYRKHHSEPMDVETFKLTDEDFESFKELAMGREVKYESQTSLRLKALERAAKDDRNTELSDMLATLKEQIKDDTESNLDRYRKEIVEMLTSDAILRRHYSVGVTRNTIGSDEEVLRAKAILLDESEQQRLLSAAE